MSGKGNRRHVRVMQAFRALVVGPEGQEDYFWLKDLSVTGLFVLTDNPWAEGTELQLHLSHGTFDFRAKARVVRALDDGVGMEFADPDEVLLENVRGMLVELTGEETPMQERRSRRRLAAGATVTWSTDDTEQMAALENISADGAAITTKDPPPADTTCYVHIPTMKTGEIAIVGCTAKVVHSEEEGFGVQFEEPSEQFISAVEEMVKSKG